LGLVVEQAKPGCLEKMVTPLYINNDRSLKRDLALEPRFSKQNSTRKVHRNVTFYWNLDPNVTIYRKLDGPPII